MSRRPTRRRVVITAIAASTVALTIAGCSGGTSGGSGDEKVTLKVSLFGAAAEMKDLITQYEDENPNVTVEVSAAANSEDARTGLLTKMAAGSGLADIEMLEISWIGELRKYADKFVSVADDGLGGWVPAQAEPVTIDDKLFAYGIGLGPTAICYRSDLLDEAGVASDTDAVTAEVGGSWDDYFAAGEAYVDAGGGPWYDSSYMIYLAQVEQLEFPYEDADGNVVVDNPEVEAIFKDTLALAPKLSANLSPFSEDWNAGFGSGAFATTTCPSWLLTTIEGNSPGVTSWNVANAFPGGGGNLGGSYLAIPTASQHPEQAAALASWLSAPDQQVALFKAGSAFPSRDEALTDPALTEITNEFFNDAPVGQIFADRSTAITTVTFKGPHFIAIDTAAWNAISRVEAGQQSIDDAWDQFVQESEAAAE
jgi:cellobiose transport system substrate-binding protein